MKIDEVIKIYEFLGNLDWAGFVSVFVLLIVAMLALLAPLKDKMEKSAGLIPGYSGGLVGLIVIASIALVVLYHKARNRSEIIQLGNFVKQDLLSSNYKQKSFSRIDLDKLKLGNGKKQQLLLEMIAQIPAEFVHVTLLDTNNKPEDGVCLVNADDLEIINKTTNERAIVTARLIADYLRAGRKDSISTREIQQLDYYGWLIGPTFINALVGRNGLKPIYDLKWNIAGFTYVDVARKDSN